MNSTDLNVSPCILSFQSFLSLGRIELEGSLKLNYTNGQNKDLDKNIPTGSTLKIHCLSLLCTKHTYLLTRDTVKYHLSFKVKEISMWRL